MRLSRMKKQRKALTYKETVIAMYCPFEAFHGLQFRWLLRQVLREAGSGKLSDAKLTKFQEKYTPVYGSIEFNTLVSDMLTEYRKAIGAESYLSLYRCKSKE